jgi:LacI family transcriptional regulator
MVAPATRQRVADTMQSLGFVRNGPARQLRGVPSRMVGVVTLDVANPFYAELHRGIEDRLSDAGCVVLCCSTDVQLARENEALSVLEELAVRGIIIASSNADLNGLRQVSGRGTPVVLLDQQYDQADLCSVSVDHVVGGRLAGEHLICLGHRRIAFLRGVAIRSVELRRSGLCKAIRAAGLDPAQVLVDVAVESPVVTESTDAAVDRILADPHRPTAIMCFNDLAVLGVLHGLARRDIRVPRDMSVVGYDDLRFAAFLDPPLTTVQQPTYALGRAAAEVLLEEANDGHQHREVRFHPTLEVRRSTAPPGT